MPCFALTSVDTGSDAAGLKEHGIVCKEIYQDKEIPGIQLNFNKRYITLAPIATVIGVAFKLGAPEQLLEGKTNRYYSFFSFFFINEGGGRGIQMGPRNYLAQGCIAIPILITVEGVNILTRNLILFGQEVLCCHSYFKRRNASYRNKKCKSAH